MHTSCSALHRASRIFLCCLIAAWSATVAVAKEKSSKTTSASASGGQLAARTSPARPAATTPAEDARKLIQDALARNKYYAPGFLISRRDLEPVFSKLLEKGITTPNHQEDLVDMVLPESAQLVKLLKTPDGREFMKKLGPDPAAYDRLERMSWTRDGRKIIERLIHSKEGASMLQSLKTPEDLATFSKELAADPRTQDFALPTGKAHTAEQFLERLTQMLKPTAAE